MDDYTKIYGKAPKAGTVVPGEGTVLKEVVVTPKRPRKYRFDRRSSNIGPGHKVISETLYDEYLNGEYMGDMSGVAGQRTIYVTPFGNDTIYGKSYYYGQPSNNLMEFSHGFMETAPDRKNQKQRERQFRSNLKSSHISPNSSNDEKSAFKRAIKGRKNGGLLLQKGNKLKLISKSKDQATKDSILVNKYNDQEIQSTKPGNYKQKNGKTVWVPDRTKAPYKKQMGGSLNGVPFYQKGTSKRGLPTAPKAEDRYKNGRKEITIVHPYDPVRDYPFIGTQPIRKVTNGTASISEIIRDTKDGTPADTLYYEIPNHLPFVKVKPRYAESFGNTSSKYGINPEFHILKRRFNTAWNLAK